MIGSSARAPYNTFEELTDTERSHRGSLSIDLIDVCQSSRQCIGGDLIPIFVSPFRGLSLSAKHLRLCIS